MNKLKNIKFKYLVMPFTLILMIFIFTACKGVEFKNQKTTMAEEFSKGESMIFVAEEKNKYESRFGYDLWTLRSGDGKLKFKDYIVNNVKKFVEKVMLLKLVAKDLNVIISGNDKIKLEEAAEKYYNGLSQEDISYMECSLDDVISAYNDYHMARLVIDNLSKNATQELSISEAKVIKVQYIVFDNLDKAKETVEKLKAKGASFSYFAKTRSIETDIDMIIQRGDEMSTRFPELFYLSTNQISNILQYTNKYYLFKCVDDYMEDETEERRLEILKAMKNDEYNKNIEPYAEKYKFMSSSVYWRDIDLSKGDRCTVNQFENIYYDYFPKSIK